MPATLFYNPSAEFVLVGELLPTKFNAEGWSEAKLVCTEGRVNIWPHCYIQPRAGRAGYWLQVGAPHAVNNVTHWRDYPTGPPVPISLPLSPTEANTQNPADESA